MPRVGYGGGAERNNGVPDRDRVFLPTGRGVETSISVLAGPLTVSDIKRCRGFRPTYRQTVAILRNVTNRMPLRLARPDLFELWGAIPRAIWPAKAPDTAVSRAFFRRAANDPRTRGERFRLFPPSREKAVDQAV